VWALGMTYYRLLTGHRAYEGNAAEIMASTLMDPVGDPRVHAPDVPPAVAKLVARMSAREPAARPIDGAAAARELAALLGG
jgi:serine/threonine-protein kinase